MSTRPQTLTRSDVPRSPWSTPRLPDLVGVTTACAMLGVHRKQLARWSAPGSGDKGPLKTAAPQWVEVDGSRLWTRSDMEAFASERALVDALRGPGRGA